MSDVDIVARGMEMKWGVDRLPRLVAKELRDKFRAQKNAFDEAIMSNDAHRIERVGEAMRRAWVALDAAATKDGQTPLSDSIWTTKHPKTGEVVTVIRDGAEIVDVKEAGGRLFTLEELVKFVPAEVMRIKESFYGCSVAEVKSKPVDLGEELNDEIPF